ncbi:MAG: GatB/YqeY domain-containing protein [Proteobacteria bacterium]|nr:GatB/YqeY domain-containing protein [Pseudomonadota bacterium]
MIRERLTDALKASMKEKNERSVSTLRLILAALKDRDIAARTKGNREEVSDDEILGLLQSMIKQRRESIHLFEKGGRMELAQQEAEEIAVIEGFLPEQMSGDEMAAVISGIIGEAEAESLKDMGKVMTALKDQFPGQMDFAKASAMVKERLS